eukprot:776038-Prorocentrum_minimum.AAC.3
MGANRRGEESIFPMWEPINALAVTLSDVGAFMGLAARLPATNNWGENQILQWWRGLTRA